MRKSTFLWLVLAVFCAVSLFYTSQKVHDNREKISNLNGQIKKEEESIRVLQAEWGHLNQPEILEKLAKNHLQLAPLKGSQFAKLETIPLRPEGPVPEMDKPQENIVLKIADEPALAVSPTLREKKIALQKKPAGKKEKPATAATARHTFGDVMKSLGVAD